MRIHARAAGCLLALAAVVSVTPSLVAQTSSSAGPQDPAAAALLTKAASYLEAYEKSVSAIVADETYVQQTNVGRVTHRDLKSEVMVLNLGEAHWVQFRDVFEVDGRKVRDHDARLANMFLKPSASTLAEATRIADESSRYNLGIQRTINVPTMALTYLLRSFQPRSRFETPKADAVDGRAVSVIPFREVFSPSLIRTHGTDDVPTSGRFWIDPATGEVVKTELRCVALSSVHPVIGVTTVSYHRDAEHQLMVPVLMDEDWTRDRDHDHGRATYTNFRTFTVDVQTVKRGGGGAW
jgi:hypothetical protein